MTTWRGSMGMESMVCANRDASLFVMACIGIVMALAGCAGLERHPSEPARAGGGLEKGSKEVLERAGEEPFATGARAEVLPDECTRAQAEEWAEGSVASRDAGLKAAACYVILARSGKDQGSRLEDARRGRVLVERALHSDRRNGLAHYLMACLRGLEAENDAVMGLRLVPMIEREALEAAHLDPRVDHGGPDRLLGELYLRAPSFPVSVGDYARAAAHFRRAVEVAPDHLENRLGLVEALLAEGDDEAACGELQLVFKRSGDRESPADLRKMLRWWDGVCAKLK
jgi:hypothetical protein